MRFKKVVLMLAVGGALVAAKASLAQEASAFWDVTPKTINQYLAEDWKIVAMHFESYSNGVEYMYTLQKDKQAVQCDVFKRQKKEPEVTCRSLSGY